MYTLVLVIHVVAVFLLIVVILIQRGRGGGLIEAFSSAESLFGTKTSSFLVKSTAILAAVFFITSITLTYLSKRRSASIVERISRIENLEKETEEGAKKEAAVKAESKKALAVSGRAAEKADKTSPQPSQK